MSKVDGSGWPEESDTDTVSINSTVPSEPREEYPLEGVLAERMNGGIKEYLVQWEGYPEERCTWETESNFQDDGTLHLWQARKMRIARGLDKPYDVNALEARVEAWIAATEKRKARRRDKRRRLGLSVPSKETSEASSDEAERVPSNSPRRAQGSQKGGLVKVRVPDYSGFVVDDESEDEDDPRSATRRRGKPKPSKPAGGSSDEALTDDSLMEDLHNKAVQQRKKPLEDRTVKICSSEREPRKRNETREPPVKRRSNIPTADLPRRVATSSASHASTATKKTPKPERSQMGTAGRGPARLIQKLSGPKAKRKVTGAAVLGNWAAKVKPRKLSEPQPRKPSLGGSKPETFNKLSTKRRYEKAGRNEPAPDPKHLTFVNLKAAKEAKPSIQLPSPRELVKANEPTKTPYQLIQERLAREEEQRPADDTMLAGVNTSTDTSGPVKHEQTPSPQTESGTPPHSNDKTESIMESKSVPDVAMSSEPSLWNSARDPRLSPSPNPPAPIVHQGPIRNSVSIDNSGQEFGTPRNIAIPDVTNVDIAPPLAPASFFNDGRIKDYSDVFATIVVGPVGQEVAQVRFRGLDKPWKRLLLGIKVGPRQMHVWFRQICNAEDYRAYYHEGDAQYGGAGHIVAFPQTAAVVEAMAEKLRIRAAGGLFFTTHFTMVIYPTGMGAWSFLDGIPGGTSTEACLRFVMRTPVPHMLEDDPDFEALDPQQSILDGESGINSIFRNIFHIEYSRLIPQIAQQPDDSSKTFFLIFPHSHEGQHDLTVNFLEANDATIYSSSTPGAWDYFCNYVNIGVVLIHDAFHTLHLIPGLARLLRKTINIFAIDLHVAPLEKTLVRLFPHGAAVLLTDSVILLHPQKALFILKWFHGSILREKPLNTWKMVMRPRFRDWILKIIEDRSVEDGEIYVEIYAVIYKLLPMDLMDEDDDFQSPSEYAPMVCPKELSRYDLNVGIGRQAKDLDGMTGNDMRLVEWFAGWTRTKLEYFRKLHVICTAEKENEMRREWMRRWTYLEIMTPEECFKAHRIVTEKKKESGKGTQKMEQSR